MKSIIGALIILLGLGLAGLLVLRVWGVAVVAEHTLLRSGATLLVLALTLVGLVVVWFGFFKDPGAGYDTRPGRRAHPKANAD